MDSNKSLKLDFPLRFTFLHILERIKFNLTTLKLLIEKGIVRYEHGIGLSGRNLLSDLIISGYIINSQNEEEIMEKLYRLYATDLKMMTSFIQLFYEAGIVNDEQKNYYDETMNQGIYKIITETHKNRKLKKFPSLRQIIQELINSKKQDFWLKEIIGSYDIWIFYSKYEHIGLHSYQMTRDTDENKTTERIGDVLRMTSISITNCFEILKDKEYYQLAEKLMLDLYDEHTGIRNNNN